MHMPLINLLFSNTSVSKSLWSLRLCKTNEFLLVGLWRFQISQFYAKENINIHYGGSDYTE